MVLSIQDKISRLVRSRVPMAWINRSVSQVVTLTQDRLQLERLDQRTFRPLGSKAVLTTTQVDRVPMTPPIPRPYPRLRCSSQWSCKAKTTVLCSTLKMAVDSLRACYRRWASLGWTWHFLKAQGSRWQQHQRRPLISSNVWPIRAKGSVRCKNVRVWFRRAQAVSARPQVQVTFLLNRSFFAHCYIIPPFVTMWCREQKQIEPILNVATAACCRLKCQWGRQYLAASRPLGQVSGPGQQERTRRDASPLPRKTEGVWKLTVDEFVCHKYEFKRSNGWLGRKDLAVCVEVGRKGGIRDEDWRGAKDAKVRSRCNEITKLISIGFRREKILSRQPERLKEKSEWYGTTASHRHAKH